jgi:hypothetical protein
MAAGALTSDAAALTERACPCPGKGDGIKDGIKGSDGIKGIKERG